ncbi:hypothetical protein [Chitinophaga deserti]|uniref:hypothetical protein n=1 Tax=Chitinophaga deserti TaxID=2164099 RepID=UPI000D6CB05F|nr:hypothetical protein [Chitinophaga deserti]
MLNYLLLLFPVIVVAAIALNVWFRAGKGEGSAWGLYVLFLKKLALRTAGLIVLVIAGSYFVLLIKDEAYSLEAWRISMDLSLSFYTGLLGGWAIMLWEGMRKKAGE